MNTHYVIAREIDSAQLGHFSLAVQTGAITAAARTDEEILQFRWAGATNRAVVYEIGLTGVIATTAFAVGAISFKATAARAYTAAGSGGAAIAVTSDNMGTRTKKGNSSAAIRIATTTNLTAGTQSLDANDLGQLTTHSSGGVGAATPIIGSIYLPTTVLFKAAISDGQSPLYLRTDEGFVIRATVPATGVWTAGVYVKWAEVEPSGY